MKVGDLYRVNTSISHITSHEGNVVVVQFWTMGTQPDKAYMLVRAFNVNRQSLHDYFFHQLDKVNI
jgi:hypothetical protein